MASLILIIAAVVWVIGKKKNITPLEFVGAVVTTLSAIVVVSFALGLAIIYDAPEQLQECRAVIQELDNLKLNTIDNYTQNIIGQELTNQEQEEQLQKLMNDMATIERQINQKVNEANKLESDVEELKMTKFFLYFGGK